MQVSNKGSSEIQTALTAPSSWLSSPLLKSVTLISGATLLGCTVGMPVTLAVAATGATLYGLSARHELTYTASLLSAVTTDKFYQRQHWNEILPNLILGALPLNEHLLELIDKVHVSAVVSLLQDYERNSTFMQPITEQTWRSHQVDVLCLPAADFLPVEQQLIEQGVEYIDRQIANQQCVYVHCKAGRGRSATVVACYLLAKGLAVDVPSAISLLKERRPQISLNKDQLGAIEHYHTLLKKDAGFSLL